jgi:twitching motility protein PilT
MIYGDLVTQDHPRPRPVDVSNLILPHLQPNQRQEVEDKWELDFSYSIAGMSRFRGNIMKQRGSLAVVMRVVPYFYEKHRQLVENKTGRRYKRKECFK